MSGKVKNKCYSCEHFGGSQGDIVQCDLGKKGVLTSRGCSSYSPDNTAHCKGGVWGCYYNKTKSYSNIECGIHGHIGESRKYCPDHAALEDAAEPEKKGWCFVTTAICEILGKSDDCYELETLRAFRDQVLLTDESLKNIVFEYYSISPSIVKTLQKLDFKEEFSRYLLDNHIRSIIEKIENNQNIEAIESYSVMLKEIMEKK